MAKRPPRNSGACREPKSSAGASSPSFPKYRICSICITRATPRSTGAPFGLSPARRGPARRAKSRDAKVLLKLRGRIWIDKATYQWAKVEAETTDTISWGLFLARLNPGASLVFEQDGGEFRTLVAPKRLSADPAAAG